MATSENISLEMIKASVAGSKTTLRAKVSFDDARQLGSTLKSFRDPPDSLEKSEEEILFGETEVTVQFPEIQYQRLLDARSLIPVEGQNSMTKRLLGDSQITYKIHLPTEVKTHNADSISSDGQTLTWQIQVADLLTGTREMRFTCAIPNLPLYFTLAGLLLLAVVLVAFLLWKRRRKFSKTSI